MIKLLKNEFVFVLFCVIIFIALRSIHFVDYLTFNGWDHGEQARQVLDIFRKKELVLIGPPITAVTYQSRQLFLGPVMTYMMILFMSLGNWNPITASYIFMIFAALMIIPLYYGVKWLINKRVAWIMVIIYTLLPYYLTYTRFLWNPNFQFALIPILFLFMGLYQKTQKNWFLLLTGFWLGILLQLHYQFAISIVLIAGYYLIVKKVGIKKILLFIGGLLLGVSPLILFELRNHFYLTNTLMLFYQHRHGLDVRGNRNHYYLTVSFVMLLGFLGIINRYLKKFNEKTINFLLVGLSIILFIFSSQITLKNPDDSFWAIAPHWNYLVDVKAYEIIKSQHLSNFNVTNQVADSLANVQKFLLERDQITYNNDYWHEKYLFVIDKAGKSNFMDNPGYEVLSFRPYKIIKTWKLNDYYNMYLVERQKD